MLDIPPPPASLSAVLSLDLRTVREIRESVVTDAAGRVESWALSSPSNGQYLVLEIQASLGG